MIECTLHRQAARLIAAGLIVTAVATPALAQPAISVFVDANKANTDAVSQQIEYFLKKDIAASSRFSLAYKQSEARFWVTLSAIKIDSYKTSSAYSSVLILSPDSYVTDVVGICGVTSAETCAADVFSRFANAMDEYR